MYISDDAIIKQSRALDSIECLNQCGVLFKNIYITLGGKQQKCIPHNSEGWKSKSKVTANLVCGEDPLPGLQSDPFLLCPHMLCPLFCLCLCGH